MLHGGKPADGDSDADHGHAYAQVSKTEARRPYFFSRTVSSPSSSTPLPHLCGGEEHGAAPVRAGGGHGRGVAAPGPRRGRDGAAHGRHGAAPLWLLSSKGPAQVA